MNRLKELRRAHGFKSQKDLADVLFVNQTAVSQWERGATMPSSQMLVKLSKMYGVSVDYLLGNSDEKVPASIDPKEKPPAQSGELSAAQNEAVQFIKGLSDDQLIRFINMGRAAFEMGGSQQTQNASHREAGG